MDDLKVLALTHPTIEFNSMNCTDNCYGRPGMRAKLISAHDSETTEGIIIIRVSYVGFEEYNAPLAKIPYVDEENFCGWAKWWDTYISIV